MNLQKIKKTFKDKLAPSGWDRILGPFIDSNEFDTLITELSRLKEETGITPDNSEMFRAFYECPYKDLSVVMVGQD